MIAERTREFELLDEDLVESSSGRGRVVLLSGTVASGKTTLLRAFCDRHADGVWPLFATAPPAAHGEPFGVLRQLFEETPWPRDRLQGLLGTGQMADCAHCAAAALLELAEDTPLVVVVDDVHYADKPSIRCLLKVAHRNRSSRLMLVLAESTCDWSVRSVYRMELVRQSHFRRVPLAHLSVAGVREVLAEHLGTSIAQQVAEEVHDTTGGNQLLVRALAEDYVDSLEYADRDGWAVGESYRQAVLTCLYRSGHEVLEVARALAVLDIAGSAQQIAHMLEKQPRPVRRALQRIERLGLTTGGRFRHPAARAAVYDDVDPGVLADLHFRAALLLYRGRPCGRAADHLVASRSADKSWAVAELRRAAEEALAKDDDETAIRYLEFALHGRAEPRERAGLSMLLVVAKRRSDPAAAVHHWAALMRAHRQGLLSVPQVADLLRFALWHGFTQDAEELVDWLGRAYHASDGPPDGVLLTTGRLLRHTYPSFLPPGRQEGSYCPKDCVPLPSGFPVQAAEMLSTLLREGVDTDGSCSRMAEQILHNIPLSDEFFEAVMSVLQTLVFSGQLPQAARWCDDLLAEAARRGVPRWQAQLMACRAEIDLRKGALPDATRNAEGALTLLGPDGWGVGIGAPIGILVSAATARGDVTAARGHLRRRVPEAMFQTRFGLQYLQARGQYYLAVGQPHAALADFRYCGRLMASWDIDAPAFLPWRSQLAEVLLQLGDTEAARSYAKQQIARARSHTTPAYGMALRLLAQTADRRERPRLLKEAAEVLHACGARLPLVQTLTDLGYAYEAGGNPQKARMLLRRAGRLAEVIGLPDVPTQAAASKQDQQTRGSQGHSGGRAERSPAESPPRTLTVAERKVAALAGLGYSNREIAQKLYVTVSTVEQHLTKAFRKLNVKSRDALPLDLELDIELPSPSASAHVDP
ncbi:helix-turn-helix transcriptional regulator [Streptomyces diacarni]|uniref:helix-turn-helix transcriptional regulator n=1 Tax=Streptomyces diacarni TaxID=2800381 RepID=UPI0015F00158|nr:LuxR family transcriptional regulator [Streptomyces diacarni]